MTCLTAPVHKTASQIAWQGVMDAFMALYVSQVSMQMTAAAKAKWTCPSCCSQVGLKSGATAIE